MKKLSLLCLILSCCLLGACSAKHGYVQKQPYSIPKVQKSY